MHIEELFSVNIRRRPGKEINIHKGNGEPRVRMVTARAHIGGAKTSVEVVRHEGKRSRGLGNERKETLPT
jgi:hypothetical protein